MLSLCNHWEFTESWSDAFASGEASGQAVRLPHTVREMPLHYADHNTYQMICGYRRDLFVEENARGKRLFLQFDAAGHIATVYVNQTEVATHRTGYTAFRVEITDFVHYGENNQIAVRLDATENPAVPPFGFVIDYLTYGGLYREVWLDIREQSCIQDIYVTTPTTTTAQVAVCTENADDCRIVVELVDADGCAVASCEGEPCGQVTLSLPDAKVWDTENPYLYTCRVSLKRGDSSVDVQETVFGFRTAQFKADGFYLNGKKTFLRGLNRHQCYPYVGYAAPESLQRQDARILKQELGCTAVRTSHYPQSQYFIDECDRLGLIVFTEIPGWQHIGGPDWQDQACENVKEMVLQYRNHPSIVLWGVRINESMDNDALYQRTNAIAHELDPSRPTSGVRCIQKSSLLEDVYAYNDFSHEGNNPGTRRKKDVTTDMQKGYLVSEHSGHMFPTKAFDTWERRQEHALRHARVQDSAAASGEHAGCFGWCMFDYLTHKDFGSGDRVCYHGVLDTFRNPKTAASVYASQQEKTPVLTISSNMDIGDYPGGELGKVYAFTNADEVHLYKNDRFVSKLSKKGWKGLPHAPMLLDDPIGGLLETQEGFPPKKAALLRKCLLNLAEYGLGNMPLSAKLLMGWCILRYRLTMDDGMALYGKYIGNWGGESTVWRFDAVQAGQVVVSVTCCPNCDLHLEVTPSHTTLSEGASYDMASVRVRILDKYGNPAPYAQLPVQFTLTGDAHLVGPETVTAEGGMCGTYIRTTGVSGTARLTVSTSQTNTVTVDFSILA